MSMTLPVSYTTVSLMQNILPEIGSVTTLTSAHIAQFAGQAESIINAKIIQRYSLPITREVPLLQTLSTDISIYYLLSRRLFTANQLQNSPWPDRYKEAMEILEEVATGKLDLVDSSGAILGGRTDQALAFSTTQDNVPTFWEGAWPDQQMDVDKIESEAERRGLTVRNITK